MMHRRAFICFFFLLLKNIYSAAGDEFDFFAEDIDANQLKTIEVMLPDTHFKGWEYREDRYIIKIGNDGIIRSIVLTNGNRNRFIYIYRKNNLLNIKSSEQKPAINNVKWDNNNVYVRGMSGAYYSKDNKFTTVNVNPGNDVVYESYVIKLLKTSNISLKEINSYGGTAFSYSDNVTECFTSDYRDSKIVYRYMPSEIIAVYYGGMEGEDEYSPLIRIKIGSNTKLFSEYQHINVINYFTMKSINADLAETLFPLLFLENPFSSNNWNYDATSFLKERDAEYHPKNLSLLNGLPWASANGHGIGDKITIDMGLSLINSIMIINGFVSKDRPDLFASNSRVKQIRIKNLNNGKSKIRIVEDTPTPQNIDIRDLGPGQNLKLEIEILSVYPGSKYKDLCIQSIF